MPTIGGQQLPMVSSKAARDGARVLREIVNGSVNGGDQCLFIKKNTFRKQGYFGPKSA